MFLTLGLFKQEQSAAAIYVKHPSQCSGSLNNPAAAGCLERSSPHLEAPSRQFHTLQLSRRSRPKEYLHVHPKNLDNKPITAHLAAAGEYKVSIK